MESKELDMFSQQPEVEKPQVATTPTPEPTPEPEPVPSPEPTPMSEPVREVVEDVPQDISPEPATVAVETAVPETVIPEQKTEEPTVLPASGSASIAALFSTFFKIGIVTFGGGYAMIPMIESEVVDKKKWIEREQFLDLIAIAQTCPGVFAINISTFVGYKMKKEFGACMAALGAALPSFIIILLLATVFRQFQDVPWVAACFRGIRPAVVALIAVPTFNLAKSAKINFMNCWIPIISALLIWALGVNPILIIIAAAFGGYLFGRLLKS